MTLRNLLIFTAAGLACLVSPLPLLAQMPVSMPPANICAGQPDATVIPVGAHEVFSGDVVKGCVTVRGTLTIAENTHLKIRTLHALTGSSVIAAGAGIVIETADERPTDAGQYGTGLVFEGRLQLEGRKKTAWTRLTGELAAGADTFDVVDASGWEVGDRLVIAETRETFAPAYERQATGPETFIITKIDGRTLSVDRGATYEHPGARHASGELTGHFAPVGNLTRSINIRSANATGVRGHMMVTRGATGYIRHVAIRDFGRTTNEMLHEVTNHIGRYSAHIHMATVAGFDFSGNSVADFQRWGITVHGTNGQTINDNVVFNGWGAGLMTEDGTERNNVISRNLVIAVRGTGSRGDERSPNEMGVNGSCFWFQGPLNRADDNVAANCQRYAFTVWSEGCIGSFARNEAISSITGLSPWYLGSERCTSYIDRFQAWHNLEGRFSYPTVNLVFRDWWSRNDPRVQRSQYQSISITAGDYSQRGLQDIRPDIQNANVAIGVPYGNGGNHPEHHIYLVSDGRFDNNGVNIHQFIPYGSYNPVEQAPHTVIIRNTAHGRTKSGEMIIREFRSTPHSNFIQVQRLIVQDHNGVRGDTFEVFYREQAPAFTIPPFGVTVPEPALTNEQAWAKYKKAIAGAIAPCAMTRDGVRGFVCAPPSIPDVRSADVSPAAGRQLPAAPKNVRVHH